MRDTTSERVPQDLLIYWCFFFAGVLIQRLNKQHGHVSSCCHKISHATSIKCTLRGRSEQNCFVKLTNVKRLLLLIVVHCKIICLALRRSALIIIYTATTCPSYDGLHDSLIYTGELKCDLCTCIRGTPLVPIRFGCVTLTSRNIPRVVTVNRCKGSPTARRWSPSATTA